MKSTGSLDDAGKPTGLSSATGETAVPGDNSIAENKRRRLVRGAVAFAPLVLTLRSGALAAASCTGTKRYASTDSLNMLNKKTDRNGVALLNTPDSGTPDKCVVILDADKCPAPNSNKILTHPQFNYASPAIVTRKGNELYCGDPENNVLFQNKKVAILSSNSATSL